MGEWIDLKAADGFELKAWRSAPKGEAKGAVVVIQEIFGVNHHMRTVCARFAAQGYAVVAPALFDRAERGVELGYGPDDVARGRELRGQIADRDVMLDV